MSNNDKIAAISNLSAEQVAIVKNTVAKGTTDTELAYFLQVANSYNLSPFKKEVWCYKDGKGNVLVFAGRDGHLAAAQKDRRWSGIASSEVRANDVFSVNIPEGEITHTFGMKDRGEIVGAYAIAKPKGCDISTIEVVAFDVYNKGYGVWKSDPASMIKKVAETHCLKKAYGLSGLVCEYDFDVVNDKVIPIDMEASPSNRDIARIEEMINNSTFDHDQQERMMRKLNGLTWAEYDELKSRLEVNQLDPITENGNYSQTDLKQTKLFNNE